MELHSVLFIEDDPKIVEGVVDHFSEDKDELGYNIMPSHYLSLEELESDSDMEISSISMRLVCVDNNLPGGINGDQIIKLIRSYEANKDVPIIFYSWAKNELELKEILENIIDDTTNIYYAHQNDLEERMMLILED